MIKTENMNKIEKEGKIQTIKRLKLAYEQLIQFRKTLSIYKENFGMNRLRETLLERTKARIPMMQKLIETVFTQIEKELEEEKK